jgi:hypothetical protein
VRTGRCISVGWLVALGALGCLVVPISPALGYTADPPSSALICVTARVGAELTVEHMHLEPANSATVPAGTPVTFSGESNRALTFNVASSQALLSRKIGSGVLRKTGEEEVTPKITLTSEEAKIEG